jgi:biopolymer transport protein ExbD
MSISRFMNKSDKPPGLMLTSLLDMFTIILIFLIVSFEAEDQEFELNPDVDLPESSSRSVFKPAVNLTVTEDSVIVSKSELIGIDDIQSKPEYFEQGQIPPLVDKLEDEYDAFLAKKQEEGEENPEAIMVVQADQSLSYDTLYLILRSASVAGFSKYRLATMKE